MDVTFTAGMEEKLDQISEGERELAAACCSDFYGPFKETLAKAEQEMRDVKREEIPTDINCEKCGKTMVIKWGKMGRFLACSGLPRVQEHQGLQGGRRQDRHRGGGDHRRDLREVRPADGHQARPLRPVHGLLRATRSARRSKPLSIGVACPDCKVGYLTERRSRRGKVFFGCNRYPDCKFAAWDRPLPETCPQCAVAVPAPEVLASATARTSPARTRSATTAPVDEGGPVAPPSAA